MDWLLRIFDKAETTDWVKAVIFVSSVNFHGDTWNLFPED